MFLRNLDDDQKRALWVIAYHLVVADHSVSHSEGELLDELTNGLRTQMPLSPQQLMEKPQLAVFNSRNSRVAVMLEILTVALGDNMFPAAESAMVKKLAHDLGFSDKEFADMKIWAEKNCALLEAATEMMEGA